MRHNADINFHAYSTKNGICFCSNKYENYGSYAFVDDCGKIVTCWEKEEDISEKTNIEIIKKDWKYFIPLLPFFMYVVTEIFKTDSFRIEMRMAFLLFGFVTFYMFGLRIFQDKKYKPNSFKFHAAEHMCINAFEDLGRVPTIYEIKKYSRFCNFCGTNIMILVGVIFLITAGCTFFEFNNIYWILCAIVLSIIAICLKHIGIFNIFQRLTTTIPTEKELFVAIAAIDLWNKKENEYVIK